MHLKIASEEAAGEAAIMEQPIQWQDDGDDGVHIEFVSEFIQVAHHWTLDVPRGWSPIRAELEKRSRVTKRASHQVQQHPEGVPGPLRVLQDLCQGLAHQRHGAVELHVAPHQHVT